MKCLNCGEEIQDGELYFETGCQGCQVGIPNLVSIKGVEYEATFDFSGKGIENGEPFKICFTGNFKACEK